MKNFFKAIGYILFFAAVAVLSYIGIRFIRSVGNIKKDIEIRDSYVLSGSFYYQLNEQEREIYDGMIESLRSGSNTYKIASLKKSEFSDTLSRVITAVEYDHPELFWVRGGYTTVYTRTPTDCYVDIDVTLSCYQFWEYSSDPQRYYDALMRKVDEVAALASNLETDYEKAVFFYEYLAKNTEYDYERLAEAQKTVHPASSELIYTPYACLVEGKAVCSGYSKAYKLLLNRCGINCYYVTGKAGGPHGWNCVELDGEYYHVDVTWGDGKFTRSDGTVWADTVNYEYCCVTEKDITVNHTVDESKFDYPYCKAVKYDYCVYNGYLKDVFTKESAAAVLAGQNDKNPAILRFTTYGEYKNACDYMSGKSTAKEFRSNFGYDIGLVFKDEKYMILAVH